MARLPPSTAGSAVPVDGDSAASYASPPRAPTADVPLAETEPSTSPPPAATKRRATSLTDLFPRPAGNVASAKTAVASAFASMSSKTTQRLAKFRSSSDNFMKHRPNVSTWKLPSHLSLRRAGGYAAGPAFRWTEHNQLQHGSARFEYHGEDVGAASDHFHIVADGVSSPFGRESLAMIDYEPVSSAFIANEVVRCVRAALQDVTNANHLPLDVATFESTVVEGIKTARINCFQYRKSRLATTLSVAYFDRWNGKLLTFTLGDSKCIVVRNGCIVYETPAVLREFNVPCVVNLSAQVANHDYVVQSFPLQENDVCLTFSDGIGDNLYKDDITSVIDRLSAPSDSGSLQGVCELLVNMSKAQHSPNISHQSASPVFPLGEASTRVERPLYPFATAAALEYRSRAVEESDGSAKSVDHLAASLALYERHKDKQTLDRHVIVRKASRKRHYALVQLRRMAEMQTKKPDDITLFATRFIRQGDVE